MLMILRVFLLILLGLPILCSAQSSDSTAKELSDREKNGYKGPVKSAIWKDYSTNKVIDIDSDINESLLRTVRTDKFDLDGRRIYDYSLCLLYKCEEGKPLEPDPPVRVITDDQGKLIEKVSFYKDGTISQKEVPTYATNGKQLKTTFFDGTGNISRVNIYGHQENLIECQYYRGGLIYESIKYDESGYLIERVEDIDHPDYTWRWVFKHNDGGAEIEVLLYTNNQPFPSIKLVNSYENDLQGNWIKCVTLVWEAKGDNLEFRNSHITRRIISYYDHDKVKKLWDTLHPPVQK